jgi:two-component system OmpR family response regulator
MVAPAQKTAVRILVVEDEPAVATAVAEALRSAGHAVDTVGDGTEALNWLDTYTYDLVVLDIVLPGLGGFDVCEAIRRRGNPAAVLMLTALDEVEHRVAGLDVGADDYLAKPFAMAELLARVRALLRRDSAHRELVVRVDGLELDPATRAVRRNGSEISVTAREFALLFLLASRAGQVFSQERIIDALWDAEFATGSNIVEVYIHSLRRKVDRGRRDGLIETVRGVGYRMRPEPRG